MSEYQTCDLLIEAIDEESGGPLTKEGVELVRRGWERGQAAMQMEITTLRQQLEQAQAEIKRLKQANFMKGDLAIEWKVKLDKAQARVAKLEDVVLQVHRIATAEPKDRSIAALTGIDWSAEAWLLRKQAEAVDQTADAMALQGCNPSDTYEVRLRVQRLRQQADEIESKRGEP